MHRKNSVIACIIRHYLSGNSASLICYWGNCAWPLLLGDPYFSVRIISNKKNSNFFRACDLLSLTVSGPILCLRLNRKRIVGESYKGVTIKEAVHYLWRLIAYRSMRNSGLETRPACVRRGWLK
jgi:hypothetical protein